MGQSIDANKKSIGELLGTSERRPVVLPEFQRPFSWEKSQIASFWGDLQAFLPKFRKSPIDASYFLGPIVVLDDSKKIIVLDGQQRLATSTILLSKIRDLARSLGAGAQVGQDFARDLQRDIIEKSKSPLTYSLTLGELDEPFFRAAIKCDPPTATKATLRSHQLIQAAAEYFANELGLFVQGQSAQVALESLGELQTVVTKAMTLVAVTVKDEEDAYDIFESLNDRGLRLSVPDLVVNLLLRRCPDTQSRQTVRQKWNTVIQELGKRDVSRFLRHLWISQFGDLKARGLYSEIKTYLVEKKLTSLTFADRCADEADTYVGLIERTVGLSKQAKRNMEGLLDHLGANNALPLLLSGYLCLNDSDFEKLLKTAVSLYVRHTLIANQNPLDLETAFYDAAREIRAQHGSKVPSGKCLAAAKAILTKLNPSDAIVKQKAASLVLSRSEASWFMAEIANNMQSQTKEVGMDKANVEHIFPQNAGTEWPNRVDLIPYIWHVGNLTILGKRINTKAKNKAFVDKCKDNYSKSEIAMTKALVKSYKTWDEAAIKKRAEALADLVVTIWK
jgi:hypothetical protein